MSDARNGTVRDAAVKGTVHPQLTRAALGGIVLLDLALVVWGACSQSPTLNEPAHLAAGLIYWRTGRFDFYAVNPPLPRLVAALPALWAGARLPPDVRDDAAVSPCFRPETLTGAQFLAANAPRGFSLVVAGRIACATFSLLGAICCWCWARELSGPRAAWCALLLWCFTPDVLGHAQLATPDVPAAACGVFAGYTFWRWLRRPTGPAAALAGGALGLALLTKLTWIVLLPLWPAIWLILRRSTDHEEYRFQRPVGQLALVIAGAVGTLNLGYGFQGSLSRLDAFRFCCRTLSADTRLHNRFRDTFWGGLRLPVPSAYVRGFDLQRADFETGRPAYLHGKWSARGWHHYYLYALCVKLPIGHWALLLLWIAHAFSRHARLAADGVLCLWGPPLAVLALVSFNPGVNQHLRYALPAYPFVFVALSRLVVPGRPLETLDFPRLAWFCLFPGIISSLMVFPHSLAYFNEAAGGPRQGPRRLLHSNVDWGQDLLFLEAWRQQHPHAAPFFLAYFGGIDPRTMGVDYAAPDRPRLADGASHNRWDLAPGWYAVSVNLLYEPGVLIPDGAGGITLFDRTLAEEFLTHVPDDLAGYSIRIYHIR